jgi:hypothetical protein
LAILKSCFEYYAKASSLFVTKCMYIFYFLKKEQSRQRWSWKICVCLVAVILFFPSVWKKNNNFRGSKKENLPFYPHFRGSRWKYSCTYCIFILMLFLICRTFTYNVYENVRVMYYSLKCFILVWLLSVHRKCIIAVHTCIYPKTMKRREKKRKIWQFLFMSRTFTFHHATLIPFISVF